MITILDVFLSDLSDLYKNYFSILKPQVQTGICKTHGLDLVLCATPTLMADLVSVCVCTCAYVHATKIAKE